MLSYKKLLIPLSLPRLTDSYLPDICIYVYTYIIDSPQKKLSFHLIGIKISEIKSLNKKRSNIFPGYKHKVSSVDNFNCLIYDYENEGDKRNCFI